MADKTIPELDSLTAVTDTTNVPVDSGTQTYKITALALLKSSQQLLKFTSTERDSIVAPDAGLEIFNTTQKCKQVYTGTAWVNIGHQTGDITYSGASSAADGYLACDGSAISRTTYSDLFSKVGTSFGTGDGSSTFNLPTIARRVLVGLGGSGTSALGNTIGSTGGAETHTLTTTEMPSHNHGGASFASSGHKHPAPIGITSSPDGDMIAGETSYGRVSGTTYSTNAHSFVDNDANSRTTQFNYLTGEPDGSATIPSQGSSGAHNNLQPSLVVAAYIKY